MHKVTSISVLNTMDGELAPLNDNKIIGMAHPSIRNFDLSILKKIVL